MNDLSFINELNEVYFCFYFLLLNMIELNAYCHNYLIGGKCVLYFGLWMKLTCNAVQQSLFDIFT